MLALALAVLGSIHYQSIDLASSYSGLGLVGSDPQTQQQFFADDFFALDAPGFWSFRSSERTPPWEEDAQPATLSHEGRGFLGPGSIDITMKGSLLVEGPAGEEFPFGQILHRATIEFQVTLPEAFSLVLDGGMSRTFSAALYGPAFQVVAMAVPDKFEGQVWLEPGLYTLVAVAADQVEGEGGGQTEMTLSLRSSSVPEASPAWLAGLALVGWGVMRRALGVRLQRA